MVNIGEYFRLSDVALTTTDIYTNAKDFQANYAKIYHSERDSFLRHFLINNVPYVFKQKPLLYEQITQYLADNLNISPAGVKLIGSGKSGFSISPPPNYGNLFSPNSDLDFSIISESLFVSLENEFESWASQYKDEILLPRNKNQEYFWPKNLENCSKTIGRGFIDTYKIPSYFQFSMTQKINNSLFLIQERLGTIYNIKVKKASVRVYKSWNSFSHQLKLNTERVLSTLIEIGI